MIKTTAARPFEVRHVQLARALFAAIAALMVTFSPDHSAVIGLSIFSGFAMATGLVLLAAAWLVYPAGRRWPSVVLGTLFVIAGLASGVSQLRFVTMFFVIVIAWALATGLVETIVGARGLRQARRLKTADAARSESRDALSIGILTLVLGVALFLVPTQYALEYTVEEADATFTLTGIIIGVGVFGGYAAIVAVYLAIAGFSPRRGTGASVPAAETSAERDAEASPTPVTDERGVA
ncbi:MAG TPA: acyl-CoA synthetase [Microbacterium sp.]|nr:acyl-CoA synthetase [Microbacterium sp.]